MTPGMDPKFNPTHIKIIVALGNPDGEYAGTYHNVAREAFASWGVTRLKNPKGKRFAYGSWEGYTVVEPTTFMNESGSAVREALDYFKVEPEALVIVHDDADLTVGEWRIEFERGDAGHNGVKSVTEALGTKSFWRVRIGVRTDRPGAPRKPAGEFVLSPISGGDQGELKTVFNKISEVLSGGGR